ncbi:hypothetical protein [Bradyrhizobium sp.]|jgi:hypothetical protein|uniref:hypothetical protein n=1 Tax=Bradyrhizobium sp. TaxID=376 RepID=UPI003C7062A8
MGDLSLQDFAPIHAATTIVKTDPTPAAKSPGLSGLNDAPDAAPYGDQNGGPAQPANTGAIILARDLHEPDDPLAEVDNGNQLPGEAGDGGNTMADDPHLRGEPGTPLGRSADALRMMDNARDALNDAKLAASENPDSLALRERADARRIELGDALKTSAWVCGAALEQAREGNSEPGEITELEHRLWIAAIGRDEYQKNPVTPKTALGRAEAADRAWDKARGEFFATRHDAISEFADRNNPYHYASRLRELRNDMVASKAALGTFAIAEVSECEHAVEAAKTDAATRAGVSVDDPRVNDDPLVIASLRRLAEANDRMKKSDGLLNQPNPVLDRINGILQKHPSDDIIDDRD